MITLWAAPVSIVGKEALFQYTKIITGHYPSRVEVKSSATGEF
jgi:hypothetical protein